MIKNYFSLDEDFNKIIKNTLPDKKITSIRSVTTGWTNIVFEVSTDVGNYFFRFPRDEFWSKTIVKDYEFSKFIYGKTDFKTVKLQLFYDNNRPYTIHEKIEGTVLADKMNEMTKEEIKIVSQDIAKFMYQLHNIPFNTNEIFKINNIGLNLTDFLNELLNVHVSPEDKVFWKYEECSKKDHSCLVHGDLNSSNILLDDTCHVSAIIDFGFAGFGNEYFDISRIIGRNCPEPIQKEIITNYENFSNTKLDPVILKEEFDTWVNIDNAYINYMRGIGIYE